MLEAVMLIKNSDIFLMLWCIKFLFMSVSVLNVPTTSKYKKNSVSPAAGNCLQTDSYQDTGRYSEHLIQRKKKTFKIYVNRSCMMIKK